MGAVGGPHLCFESPMTVGEERIHCLFGRPSEYIAYVADPAKNQPVLSPIFHLCDGGTTYVFETMSF